MGNNWHEWYKYVLQPLLKGERPTDETVQQYGGLALLATDADRSQDYVFESIKLPEIRGASRQLTDLNERIRERVKNCVCSEAVIFSGGGAALALLPDDEHLLKQLVTDTQEDYLRTTGAATVTCEWRRVRAQDLLGGYPPDTRATLAPFGTLVRWAGTWLRRRKEDKPPKPFYEALPYAVRCQSCRVRPANPQRSFTDWALCPICRAKRDYRGRNAWFKEFQAFLERKMPPSERKMLPPERKTYGKTYYHDFELGSFPPLADYDFENTSQPRWLPQDLSELGQASRRSGYVAMIYLDGDEMGSLFGKLPTAQAYQRLSEAIEKVTRNAVMAALAINLGPKKVSPSPARQQVGEQISRDSRIYIHPFEIITIGGDDVVLIVPADAALSIAASISETFTTQMRTHWLEILENLPAETRQKLESWTFTMSGGVVIADDHNPVRILYDLAVELKGIAKRARRDAGTDDIGYIDFQILKSADMLERKVRNVRRAYPYQFDDVDRNTLRLWARPYPANVLGTLVEQLQSLNLSRTQMYRLVESLPRGRQESSLFYLYQKARRPEEMMPLHKLLTSLWPANDAQDPMPWYHAPKALRQAGIRYWTPLWDIAELYDFVDREEISDYEG